MFIFVKNIHFLGVMLVLFLTKTNVYIFDQTNVYIIPWPVPCRLGAFLCILTSLPLIYHFDFQWIFVMRPQSLSFIRYPKHGWEELPHVQGQGQKPGGPHVRRAAAKRSYPTSEVRGSGRECQGVMAQKRPRGATPPPRSGSAAERSYPRLRPGAAAGRSHPASELMGG